MTFEKGSKRNPFAMPCAISKEMSLFMKKNGEQVVRMEVTQYVIDYIKSRKLSDSSKIYPDETLTLLLGTKDITFFNLDKYINKHYIK
uniref:SWIB domain-containing protein n=1 Tax=viral metagenome TaxID=1070528 RepID=A0A6C0JX90_9ZZZZ